MGCGQTGSGEEVNHLRWGCHWLSMDQCLKQLLLVLVMFAFASQYAHTKEHVAVKGAVSANTPDSSSFAAYKKAQKLHDLQLMAKWGTAKERQHSREALQKISQQALKRQQRQQQALKQQQALALSGSMQAVKPGKRNKPPPGKADRLMVVNINKAGAEQLTAALIGVGEVKAEAIVDYRRTNGAFKTLEDVLAVKGIGPATIAKNRDRIRFE